MANLNQRNSVQVLALKFGLILAFSLSGLAHAELSRQNYYVVGSYNSSLKADAAVQRIEKELQVPLTVKTVDVGGQTWYRLMFPELVNNESIEQSLRDLKIEPWLITIKSEGAAQSTPIEIQTVSNSGFGKQSLLVAEFSDISGALELERRLGTQSLPVFGKAVVKQGTIVHQVWVGPVANPEAVVQNIEQGGFKVLARENNAEQPATLPVVTQSPTRDSSSLIEMPKKTSTKQYPKDFNLARLPPKKN